MSTHASFRNRLITIIKESTLIAFFSSLIVDVTELSNKIWSYSVVAFLLTLPLKALSAIYDFIKEKNKNLEGVSKLIFNLLAGLTALLLLAIIVTTPAANIYSLIVFVTLGTNLLLVAEGITQLLGLAYHLASALIAPAQSIERKAFLQAAMSNINTVIIVASTLTLLVIPFSAPVLFALTSTFIGYLGLNIAWHSLPPLRNAIKSLFHLDTPEKDMAQTPNQMATPLKTQTTPNEMLKLKSHGLFFQPPYRKKVVFNALKTGRPDDALAFLNREINNKLAGFKQQAPLNAKQEKKAKALLKAQTTMNDGNGKAEDISKLIEANPDVYKSFFTNKADTLDILEAVKLYLRDAPMRLAPLANQLPLQTIEEADKVQIPLQVN
jgi:hypothetical protein